MDGSLDQIERMTVVRRNLIQMSNVEELMLIEDRMLRLEHRLDNSVVAADPDGEQTGEPFTATDAVEALEEALEGPSDPSDFDRESDVG